MNDDHPAGLARLIPNILRTVDATLELQLGPEIESPNGKVLIDMSRCLLQWAVAQLEQHSTLYAARANGIMQVLENASSAPADVTTLPLFPQPTAAEEHYRRVAEQARERMTRAVTVACSGSTAERHTLAAQLRALNRSETGFHRALDPESAMDTNSAFHGGKAMGRPSYGKPKPVLSVEMLTAYLRRRFPDCPAIVADNLVAQPGGMSKETLLFELRGHPDFSGALVMRKDPVETSMDVSATDEFPLLRAVHRAGIQAPEPLWAECDASALGTPFIVVRRAPGSVAIAQDFSDPAIRRLFAERLVQGLLQIHGVPLAELDFTPRTQGATIPEHVRGHIAWLYDFWLRKRVEPSLNVDIMFAWLHANIPDDNGLPPTLIHGDYGFHNLIVNHGELSAILDWEFAHVGDPAEDVNYCRQFVEQHMPWPEFLAIYHRMGGRPYSEQQDRFYTVLRNVRNAVCSLGALQAFIRGNPGDVRMGTAGLSHNPRYELDGVRLIADYLDNPLAP
jgi:aminoglycoside phosphotransferase (APT) family kinase protein